MTLVTREGWSNVKTRLRLTKLEFVIMDTLWTKGRASIREMLEGFPEKKRPTYSTVQTMVYRLEAKGALTRIRLSGNFHMFEPAITREAAQKPVIDELLAILGGESRPVVARLIQTGKLTMQDVEFAEKALKELKKEGKSK
jgi:BlaI family transcriptional regulator, penicillinase repressor